jgi:hypothetical protein
VACSDGPWEPVLRVPQQHGAGARPVPAHGRQEVAVLARRRAGPQVLRAPRPPRSWPFEKACGSRLCGRPGAERRSPRRPTARRGRVPGGEARLLPHQRPRPQRRACHVSTRAVRDWNLVDELLRGRAESAGIALSCVVREIVFFFLVWQLFEPGCAARWHARFGVSCYVLLLRVLWVCYAGFACARLVAVDHFLLLGCGERAAVVRLGGLPAPVETERGGWMGQCSAARTDLSAAWAV